MMTVKSYKPREVVANSTSLDDCYIVVLGAFKSMSATNNIKSIKDWAKNKKIDENTYNIGSLFGNYMQNTSVDGIIISLEHSTAIVIPTNCIIRDFLVNN